MTIQIGYKYKDLALWSWLSIGLFWLIFPLIVLFIKTVTLYGDLRSAGLNDKKLAEAADKYLLALILIITPTLVTQIIGFYYMNKYCDLMVEWANENGKTQAAKGFEQVGLGNFLAMFIVPVIASVILIPIGYNNISKGLLE
jgi:hypothetical protein